MEYRKLISFDFDDTLCYTPLPIPGKEIWKEKTGYDYPNIGWWSRPESLDLNVFDIELNKWVYNEYLDAVSDSDNYVVMVTGRIEKLRKEVQTILNKHNLSFEGVYLNNDGDTYGFKTRLFERLIDETNPDEFVMYDDREEHLVRFKEWAKTLPCNVTVVDVVNKTKTFIKNRV